MQCEMSQSEKSLKMGLDEAESTQNQAPNLIGSISGSVKKH